MELRKEVTVDKKKWPAEVQSIMKEQDEAVDAVEKAMTAEEVAFARAEFTLAPTAGLFVLPPRPAELCNLAEEVLNMQRVSIIGPDLGGGVRWDAGEFALFHISIYNPTCCILRSVSLTVRAYGDAAISPGGDDALDGREYWWELGPGRRMTFDVKTKATAVGSARLRIYLRAEVIPRGSTERWSAVYPISED